MSGSHSISRVGVMLLLPIAYLFSEFVWRLFLPRWVRMREPASLAWSPDDWRREGAL